MPICNLATSYVAPSTLGEPPLDTSNIDVAASLNVIGSLNAVFRLSFASESYLSSCQVQNTVLTTFDTGSLINITCFTAVTSPKVFISARLNAKKTGSLSNVRPIPTNYLQVNRQRLLSALEISALSVSVNFLLDRYSLAIIVNAASQNLTCLSNVAGANINTGILLQNILSVSNTAIGSAKFGAQVQLSPLAINCILSQPEGAKPSLPGRTVTISSTPEIAVKLNSIAGIYAQFAIAYPITKPANATPSLSSSALLSGSSRISTTPTVTCASLTPVGLAAPALLVLGAVDYPDQIQEYVRYPLPTATSAASALDEDGSPVQYSHSVFGSTLLRLTPGPASSQAFL